MSTPTIQTLELKPIVEGDGWEQPITLSKTGFDFTGFTATAKLRKKTPSGTVVHTFNPSFNVVSTGLAEIILDLSGEETAAIGVGQFIGDIVVTRASPSYEPRTLFRFKLPIESRITK